MGLHLLDARDRPIRPGDEVVTTREYCRCGPHHGLVVALPSFEASVGAGPGAVALVRLETRTSPLSWFARYELVRSVDVRVVGHKGLC